MVVLSTVDVASPFQSLTVLWKKESLYGVGGSFLVESLAPSGAVAGPEVLITVYVHQVVVDLIQHWQSVVFAALF